jgi:hypothetical protein
MQASLAAVRAGRAARSRWRATAARQALRSVHASNHQERLPPGVPLRGLTANDVCAALFASGLQRSDAATPRPIEVPQATVLGAAFALITAAGVLPARWRRADLTYLEEWALAAATWAASSLAFCRAAASTRRTRSWPCRRSSSAAARMLDDMKDHRTIRGAVRAGAREGCDGREHQGDHGRGGREEFGGT